MVVTSHTWDPGRYLAYADHRGRPFVDLLARVGATDPATVVDLGCGPGNLTALLAQRWPRARVAGVDSSAEMVARARADHPDLELEVADLRTWLEGGRADVVVSNATLQWVPDHLDLLPRLVAATTPGGWLAVQVPGNFGEPSHALLHDLAADPRWAAHVADAERPHSHDPVVYLDALAALGCAVDAWETTYLHPLAGEDPVFAWVSATGARPVLQALPDDLRPVFESEYRARLAAAYPVRADGTVVLPFRRVFVVARVPGEVPA
jgi:trans-aconitate 2-methyltransferase